MFSCQAMARPHDGQADRGRTTLRLRGKRWISTFEKLPKQAPSRAVNA
jgi:hypothetical protein